MIKKGLPVPPPHVNIDLMSVCTHDCYYCVGNADPYDRNIVISENSKIPSKWEVFSELNHNEIVGWEQKLKFSRYYSALFLRDEKESPQIKSRIEFTRDLLSRTMKTFEVWSQGSSDLAKILSTICIGDFTSVYHAIQNKIDPTPVKSINQLKKKLGKLDAKEKILIELEKFSI